MKLAILALAAMVLLTGCVAETDNSVKPANDRPAAAHRAGYQHFEKNLNNQPGGYEIVSDPVDPSSDQPVEKFTISNKSCSGEDCTHNSVRSQLLEQRTQGLGVQPRESWYSWEIYLPAEFPKGSAQSPGTVILTEFKETDHCASTYFGYFPGSRRGDDLIFRLDYTGDSLDSQFPGHPRSCVSYLEKKIGNLGSMRGRWTRFEVFMRWSQGGDGRAIIIIDGKQKLDYTGPTCHSDCMKRNPLYYGVYLSNAPTLAGVKTSTAYYRNVSRSPHRETLLGHVD